MIGILDVGIGNIGSLSGALYSQGWDSMSVESKHDFEQISHLILPGVGSFATAMHRLRQAELIKSINDYVNTGKPLLGICLGMQLLADYGSEGGETNGLGFIEGSVVPFEIGSKFRIPHVGWNMLHEHKKHPLLDGIKKDVDFYFVHSYFFQSKNDQDVIAKTNYGLLYPSFIASENVVGVQFHPEKSQKNGLRILDNFCMWDGTC